MAEGDLTLEWLPGRYAVCRLNADAADALPAWVCSSLKSQASGLISITRTERELSIVIDESRLPADLDPNMPIQRGFAALRIAGTLDLSVVGVLARITGVLAAANIPVFVISTYDTDVMLVREADQARATTTLRRVATFQGEV